MQFRCTYCNRTGATQKCAKCLEAKYCSKLCQQLHWRDHKKDCGNQLQQLLTSYQTVCTAAMSTSLSRAAQEMLYVQTSSLPGAGEGLFAARIIAANESLPSDRNALNYMNDPVLPDWVEILSSTSSRAQQDSAWQRYLTASRDKANVAVLGADRRSTPAAGSEKVTPRRAKRMIAKGEELLASYGLVWLPMKHSMFQRNLAQVTGHLATRDLEHVSYLLEMPACLIKGVLLGRQLMACNSQQPQTSLFELPHDEAVRWMSALRQRAVAALTDKTYCENERYDLKVGMLLNDIAC